MRICLLILTLFLMLFCKAQEFKTGKISKDELTQKRHPLDSSASAAVLFNTCKTFFHYTETDGFSVKHVFIMRLKIYKKEGLSFANYEIPYYIGFKELSPEHIEIKEAATYNLEGDKIIKTKVDGSSMVKEKVNDYWKTNTIVFPAVKQGSVIEFQYILWSQNLHHFPNFRFQRDIPVDYSEYITQIPVNYIYKPVVTGAFELKADCKTESANQNYDNKYGHTETLNFQQQVCTYKALNVPALRPEPLVDNLNNYRLSIDHELELIRFPNVTDKNLSQTWEGLVKTIWEDKDFGKQLSNCTFLDNQVRQLINEQPDYRKRMQAVFTYVQTNMNWNGTFGFFTETGINKAFQTGTGNIADINLLLTAMLQRAGISASPVLVSTVKNGISMYPRQTSYNYVLVSCTIDGKIVMLDAANKFTIPGVLPNYTLNWSGRIVSADGSSTEVKMVPAEESIQRTVVMATLTADGSISGKVRRNFTSQNAFSFREKYSNQNPDTYLESLEDEFSKIEISQYSRKSNLENFGSEVESFDFSGGTRGEILGDKIYFDPILFLPHIVNEFTSNTRTLPVYFGNPSEEIIQITLTLPEGYKIESLPASIAVSTPENVCSFKFNLLGEGNKISFQWSYKHNLRLVSAAFYETLKEFFKKLSEKQNERIVLKKI